MKPKNAVMLLLTSLIWGTAFVAQSVGMDFLEPFTFNGVRSFIGGVTLLPCIWLLEKMNGKPEVDGTRKDLIQGGLPGVCFYLQQAASNRWDSVHNSRKGRIYYRFILCLFRFLVFLRKQQIGMMWMS